MISISPIATKFASTPGSGLIAIEREPEPSTPTPSGEPAAPSSLPVSPGEYLITCPSHIAIKLALMLRGILNGDTIPPSLMTREMRRFMHDLERATASVPIPSDWLRHLTTIEHY